MTSPELEKLYQEAAGPDSVGKQVPNLEDLSQAQPNVDFVPSEEKPFEEESQIAKAQKHNLEGFNGFAFLKERKEKDFMAAIKTSYTFDKLATVIDKYAIDNNLPELQVQASKIRKEEVFEPIADFGVADQYHILVKNKLNNPKA
jgi:hypothetical protein